VPDGEHIRITVEGVELLGEFHRQVRVECNCGTDLDLRVCVDCATKARPAAADT
jgi:hypothetical protein